MPNGNGIDIQIYEDTFININIFVIVVRVLSREQDDKEGRVNSG